MSSKTFKELGKHLFNSTQLLYIFSSSQLILLYFTLFYTCYRMNLYSLILLLLLMTKTLFLFPVKKIMLKSKIGKRPKGAFNCNQYNCGGVPLSGGFPSGHMLALGIIFMVIFRSYLDKKSTLIIIYFIVVITTAIGRYFTNCHTLFQIISGYLLGLIIGYFLYIIDSAVEDKIEIYKKHKKEFYGDLDKLFKIVD